MNYKKIKVDRKIYEYKIKKDGCLSFKGIVTYRELQRIKKIIKEKERVK